MHPTKTSVRKAVPLAVTNLRVGNVRAVKPVITKPPENFLLDNISSREVIGVRSPLVEGRRIQRVSAVIRQNKFKTVWVALADDVKTELAEFKCGAMQNVTFEYKDSNHTGDRGCFDWKKAGDPCIIGWATGELLNINQPGMYIPLDVACHLQSLMYNNTEGRFFDKANPNTKFTRADLVVFYPDGGARHFNAR